MIMLQKIFLFLLVGVGMFNTTYAADKANKNDIQEALLWWSTSTTSSSVFEQSNTGTAGLNSVFTFVTESLSTLLFVIAVGMFLFIGFRLVSARWNPEEFSKAMKSFVYAVVWLFVVAAAWAIVRIVAGFSTTSFF